jgi:hypothetical protein
MDRGKEKEDVKNCLSQAAGGRIVDFFFRGKAWEEPGEDEQGLEALLGSFDLSSLVLSINFAWRSML